MRGVNLTSGKGGIDRTRIKAGAKPDSLYDGLNCWVTVSLSFRPRQGTVIDAQLPSGTIGLTTFEDKLVVFSDHEVDLSAFPGYRLEILTYPGGNATAPSLYKIWFAEPFLGWLYVAAEWSDGEVFHYWLQQVRTWQPDTIYLFNDLVQPTVPNGFTYRANRLGAANPIWQPSTAYQVGDVVEPTVPNSYKYEVVDAIGTNPRSGTVEPTWLTTPGALVNDDADIVATPDDTTGGSGSPNQPPQDVIDRYGQGPNAPTTRGDV